MHDAHSHMRPTKLSKPGEGLHEIVKVYNNGKLKIQRGDYREVLCIARIVAFFQKSKMNNERKEHIFLKVFS